LSEAVSFHQTFLRSGGDSRGAFRGLANSDGLGDNISGSVGSVLLVIEKRGDGLVLLLNGSRGDSLLLSVLGVLALGGLAQRAAKGSEDGGALLLLVLSSGRLNGGLGDRSSNDRLNGLRHSRGGGVFDLGCDRVDLAGLCDLLSGCWRLGTVLSSKELSEAEVLLLLAGGVDARLLNRLDLIGLQRAGLCDGLNDGDGNLGLLEGLCSLRDVLGILSGDSRDKLALLLLVGGALDLLEERSEDARALSGLGLLSDNLGVVDLGLLNGSGGNNSSACLGLQLLACVRNLLGDNRCGGRDWM
jgi:hypothetical protein